MKILELRFKNLNSLYGEWFIDFTDPEYISNGIFALTGPTGAGKSTILDAICLSLYGATPRLGKITKNTNEIMSRRTGECYAEVLFESQAGRFRCHFSQHRARKKSGGELQNPRHEISEGIENGRVIEHQLRRVASAVEEKTGMDFERFTRSILLAQGDFDTFLKADAEQKSKILEQITGTEIYTEISRRVHERRREEQKKLEMLKSEISGIMILEPEREKEIQQDLKVKQKQEKELADKLDEVSRAIAWLNTINEVKKEISSLSEKALELQTDIKNFKPEQEKLDRALSAASLDGLFSGLKAVRKQHLDDETALKDVEKALPKIETSAVKHSELLKSAERHTIKAKEELKAALPLFKKVRFLDQKLDEQKKSISEREKSIKKDAAKIDADKQARLNEYEKRNKAEKHLESADAYLKKHAQDEWLISGLTGVEEQLNNLILLWKDISKRKIEIKKAGLVLDKTAEKLCECAKQCTVRKREIENISIKLRQEKNVLRDLLAGRLLREYRTEKETLLREMAFLTKIAELKDYRAKLEDGKPCPLCGSKDHPFAKGNVPVPDEIERRIEDLTLLITKAEDLEIVIKELEKADITARKNLADTEKQETAADNDRKTAEKALEGLKDGMEKFYLELGQLKESIFFKLQPLGIKEMPESRVSSLLDSLKFRKDEWQKQTMNKNEIERQISSIDGDLKRLDAVIDTQTNALIEKQKSLEVLKQEYAAGMDERRNLYGDKKPDDEEKLLNESVTKAEEEEKKIRSLSIECQQKLNTAKSSIEALKTRIKHRLPELQKMEADFLSALEQAGFSDEKQFLKVRLTKDQIDALSIKAKKLDECRTELELRLKDRKARLAEETAKQITDKAIDDLRAQFKEYDESLKNLGNAIAEIKFKLRENISAKERLKGKQAAIELQKKEYHRWDKLHGLIGSSDGKKYRNFAQGLTFELMVSHANRQLQKMTDRYLLIRDKKQPLELNVIDNYQAGEIRSTKNLSGGESFIVSLSLALGLSRMASRKVRVDSLFLDEGFGTLDEEALEEALETLSGLQQDGKLIGIISHVSALKERISTQINIIPLSGGKSIVKGPGCMRIE